jgi:hypothetical protein
VPKSYCIAYDDGSLGCIRPPPKDQSGCGYYVQTSAIEPRCLYSFFEDNTGEHMCYCHLAAADLEANDPPKTSMEIAQYERMTKIEATRKIKEKEDVKKGKDIEALQRFIEG